MSRQHDDPGVRIGILQSRHELQPRLIGKLEIDDRILRRVAFDRLQSVIHRVRDGHRKAAGFEGAGEDLAERAVVVDKEQAGAIVEVVG